MLVENSLLVIESNIYNTRDADGFISDNKALIITGDALIYALKPNIAQKIVKITEYCRAVLCCRVSPK